MSNRISESLLTLEKFEVNNFKSIQSSGEINLSDFNVFVGKNDAGKSSFVEALKIFLDRGKPDRSHFHKYRDDDISMTATFADIPERLEGSLSDDYQSESDTISVTRFFRKRSSNTPSDTTFVNGEELSAGAVVVDDDRLTKARSRNFVWEFMPYPIHIFAERDVTEETKLKSGTLLNDLLVPVLEEGGVGETGSIAETRDSLEDSLQETSHRIGEQLTESMQAHMPDIEEVEVQAGSVRLDKAISPSISLKDRYLPESVDIGERGSGVGSLFILSLMQAYVDMQVGEGYCLMFEEPGNSLHPGAERKMLDALKGISEEGGQILITTHSQVFIDRTDTGQLYVVTRNDGESEFKWVEQDAFEAVDEIGAKNSDILQSDFVFYVEGPSDAKIIEEICLNTFGDWESRNVTIQHLGGTGNLHHCDPEKLRKINRNCAFILDSDRDNPTDDPNSTAKNIQEDSDGLGIPCRVLSRSCIENYFTASGVSAVFGISVEEGFIGEYDDAIGLIKEEVAAEYRPDGDPDNVNYDKVKHGREIVKAMYGEGEQIREIEEFVQGCLESV